MRLRAGLPALHPESCGNAKAPMNRLGKFVRSFGVFFSDPVHCRRGGSFKNAVRQFEAARNKRVHLRALQRDHQENAGVAPVVLAVHFVKVHACSWGLFVAFQHTGGTG
jgi:hypothetical protein